MSETLLLLSPETEEELASPELSYNASMVRLAAERVYDRVVTARWGGRPTDAGPVDDVLVVESARTLLSSRSLHTMRDRRRAGAAIVVPSTIADPEIAGAWSPLYTLRDYEELEEAFLARDEPGRPAAPFAAVLLDPLGSPGSEEELLGDPDLLTRERAESAGMCHRFIDYYGEVRRDVLPLLPEGAQRVLEVGCGRGVTGAFLEQELGCEVTGVELNPAVAADAATRISHVIQGDAAEVPLGGPYDAAIGFEIVEHLPAAEKVLRRIGEVVRPGGRIVLSIPNVGHYSVVEDLLAGRWDYLPIGLLCYTHFRFFTRHTLVDWLGRCGFGSFEIRSQRTELPARFDALEPSWRADLESLRTKGFYVLIDIEPVRHGPT